MFEKCRAVYEIHGRRYVILGHAWYQIWPMGELLLDEADSATKTYAMRACGPEMSLRPEESSRLSPVGYAVMFGGFDSDTDTDVSYKARMCGTVWTHRDARLFKIIAEARGGCFHALPQTMTIAHEPDDWEVMILGLRSLGFGSIVRGPADFFKSVIRSLASERAWKKAQIRDQAQLETHLFAALVHYLKILGNRKRPRAM